MHTPIDCLNMQQVCTLWAQRVRRPWMQSLFSAYLNIVQLFQPSQTDARRRPAAVRTYEDPNTTRKLINSLVGWFGMPAGWCVSEKVWPDNDCHLVLSPLTPTASNCCCWFALVPAGRLVVRPAMQLTLTCDLKFGRLLSLHYLRTVMLLSCMYSVSAQAQVMAVGRWCLAVADTDTKHKCRPPRSVPGPAIPTHQGIEKNRHRCRKKKRGRRLQEDYC